MTYNDNDNDIYRPRRIPDSMLLDIRGCQYHLSDWGPPDAPLLVYLHGWGDCGSTFQFVVDALAGNRRIVAPDWRGFGRSSHVGASYWFPDYLADLDAILDRLSSEQPVTLIGHSMGANAAALYSGTMPERVSAFVNIEGFGLRDSDPADAPRTYRRWIETGRQPVPFTEYAALDDLARKISKRSSRMPIERARFVARQWARETGDGRWQIRADPRHRLPNAVQYRRTEARECWKKIAARTLLVLGEDSVFVSGAKSWIDAGDLSESFPDAQTVNIAHAGHMVHFDAPDALANAIERFLGEP